MKPQKHFKPKIHRKPLPPHSWEAHPAASQGEANKQLIIAGITIGAIIILGGLLLFSDRIVGKAFYAGGENTAGIVAPAEQIIENTQFSLVVKAKIPADKKTVAVEFSLSFPPGVICDDVVVGVPDLLNWNEDYLVMDTSECLQSSSRIIFKFATLNYDEAKTGEFGVAQLNFKKGAPLGKYDLKFDYFNVYELDTQEDLIGNGETATIEVVSATGCGNGKKDTGENCLTCPADAACTAGKVCEEGACVQTCGNKKADAGETCSSCPQDIICLGGKVCENGACVEAAEPVCEASEYFCFNVTQVNRCNEDEMGSTLQTICKEDESCAQGACVKKVPPVVCTDTDQGLSYIDAGTASDGTITLTDKCKNTAILQESFCEDNVPTFKEVNCAALFGDNFVCKDGRCMAKPKPTAPLKIELLGATNIAVAEKSILSVGSDYKVKVTVSPINEKLAKHLVIAQVSYDKVPTAYMYENKGNLSVGGEESTEFSHKTAAKGNMSIEAFVWGNWPSEGTGNALLDKVEVTYEIK